MTMNVSSLVNKLHRTCYITTDSKNCLFIKDGLFLVKKDIQEGTFNVLQYKSPLRRVRAAGYCHKEQNVRVA